MMTHNGQPSPRQAKMMAKVFVIATLLGGVAVFLNAFLRSYSFYLQKAEEKTKLGAEAPQIP